MYVKPLRRLAQLALACAAAAPTASSAGTAYVANEETVTVSVIDTSTHTVVATIGLGSDPAIPGTPQPDGPLDGDVLHHRPFYNGHVDPHGLWLDRDASTLLVACRISGTVVAVDTATNGVLGYLPVGREPHLATVRPGRRGAPQEAWVAIRGEDYVDVVRLGPQLRDPTIRRTERIRHLDRVPTALGPSMVSFTSDGRFAFVASGKEARVEKYDAEDRSLVATQPLSARFTPFGLVSPDDAELVLVHKGAGTVSILRTGDLSFVVRDLPVGARPNHVEFVGSFAYVTVGGPAPSPGAPDPEGKVVVIDLRTHAIVNQLTGPDWTGDPHAVARTPEGDLYVGHERGNRVTVLALGNPDDPFDDHVVTTITHARMRRLIDIVVKP